MLKKISTRESLAAILSTQGDYRFYIVALPSDILGKTCFTIGREEDPIEGLQRRFDETRADAIAAYIDEGLGSIPTAIVLSAQEDAKMAYNSQKKTISFDAQKKSFLIIDGQHRVWGFTKAATSIRVPVVIYEGLTRADEARLFIDINSNQREVPQELLLDVRRMLQIETESEKLFSSLFEMFFTEQTSCLKGRLVRAEKVRGKLSRTTFNKSISIVIDAFPANSETSLLYNVVNNYIKAFIVVLEEIEEGISNTITNPVAFQGMLAASKMVIDKTQSVHQKLTVTAFENVLSALKDNINPIKLRKPGTSYTRYSNNIIAAVTKIRNINYIVTEE